MVLEHRTDHDEPFWTLYRHLALASAPGRPLCARHGAQVLCEALAAFAEANVFYMNVPYGDSGAYLWI